MLKTISLLILSASLSWAAFFVSAGGYDVFKHPTYYSFGDTNSSSERVNITEVLHKESLNTNAVSIWITRDWEEDWYDVETTQKEVIDKGYTPVFIFYWFADDISPKYVKEHKKKYFEVLRKFVTYLKKLNGQKIVVLNPEYNENKTEAWDGMNDIFLQSFKIVREDPQTIVGPCVGDFGDYSRTNEPAEWKKFDASLKRAAKKADFIAFQEMRALTRNTKKNILKTPDRAMNLSIYLHKKYKKPTMLAYVAISSYGKGGEAMQGKVFQGFDKNLERMKKKGDLMLFGAFHYFDYPGHVGYFNEAEEFFGVLRKDGTPKPSFNYYNRLK